MGLEQILVAWNKRNRNPIELAHLTALLLDALQRLAATRSRRDRLSTTFTPFSGKNHLFESAQSPCLNVEVYVCKDGHYSR